MPHTIVRNKTTADVWCRISLNDALGEDGATWHKIDQDSSKTWDRNAWEFITFKNLVNDDTRRGGSCVDLRKPKLVEFHDFDKILIF